MWRPAQITGKPVAERCAASLQRSPLPPPSTPSTATTPAPTSTPPFLPQPHPCCRRAEGVRVPLYTALSTYLGVCNQAEGAGGPPVVLEALLQGEQWLGPWTTHSPLNFAGTHDTDKRTTGLQCPCLHWDQACCMRSAARSLHKVQAPVPLLGLLILPRMHRFSPLLLLTAWRCHRPPCHPADSRPGVGAASQLNALQTQLEEGNAACLATHARVLGLLAADAQTPNLSQVRHGP